MRYRNDFIIPLIKNQKVLDLGFLGENKKVQFSDLHKLVLKYSGKSSLGVDIHKDRITKLKKKGYNVLCDNVVSLEKLSKTNEKFDVILAGELIEHVENLGIFLDNLKVFLKKNGIIILTTPNMLSLRHIARHIFTGTEGPHWKDRKSEIKYGHVIGFTHFLMDNLLLRKGFTIEKKDYTIKSEYSGVRGNLEKIISKIFPRLAPNLIYVVKLK